MTEIATQGSDISADATKLCSECREPIRIDAAKCRHCGSYQGWRGRLNASSTVLALLVALVSVVGATAPVFVRLFKPAAAAFHFTAPAFEPGSVTVTASNIGSLPAKLSWAAIMIPQKKGGQPYIYMLEAVGTAVDQTVNAGEAKLLTFNFDHRKYDTPHITEGDKPCWLDLFDKEREISCDEVRYMMTKRDASQERRGLLPEEGPRGLDHPAEWK